MTRTELEQLTDRLGAILRFQFTEQLHPLTCEHHSDTRLMPVPSIAGEIVWRCPRRDCDYSQAWDPPENADVWMMVENAEKIKGLLSFPEEADHADL